MIFPRPVPAARLAWLLVGGLLTATTAVAAPDHLEVDSAPRARVVISPNETLRAAVPRAMLGTNMQYNKFELDHWNRDSRSVNAGIRNILSEMPGALYRYPGGLPSNYVTTDNLTLPYNTRLSQRQSGGRLNDYPLFGVPEYLRFIGQIGSGRPWYTLNLIGPRGVERSSSSVAADNRELAQAIVAATPGQSIRYYQLGNELDRNSYQWSHSKYISRSRDSINAILDVDSTARFVPFMREFDWRYRAPLTGISRAQDYFNDVMRSLPMIRDFSLHFYYDGKLSPTDKFVTVPDMIAKVEKATTLAQNARAGAYGIWITEHGKRFFLRGGTPESGTSLSAGISVGDFLLSMYQMPQVQGAMLQGLEGGERFFFYNDNTPTALLQAMRVLAKNPYRRLLKAKTFSPNSSGYQGGYDIRAIAFTNSSGDQLSVSAVNRSRNGQAIEIRYPRLAGATRTMRRFAVRGQTGQNPASVEQNYTATLNPGSVAKTFNAQGSTWVWLPPSSVSTIVFE